MSDPQKQKLMTYNIWNYNANWTERKRLIAAFVRPRIELKLLARKLMAHPQQIAEQQPDLVGVQEIRYRYAGGPNQLDELAAELLARNLSYHFIYQPAMYYDTEVRLCLNSL